MIKNISLLVCLIASPILTAQWNLLTPVKDATDIVAVEYAGNNTFYLVDGALEKILKTTDNGETWNRVRTLVNFNAVDSDIHMFDEMNGLVTASGGIFRTSDGFENITPVTNLGIGATDLFFVGSEIGYTVGYSGRIHKTTDGGDTWIEQNSNTTTELRHVYFFDANTGFAVKSGSELLHTVDGGNTWNTTAIPSGVWEDIAFTDAQHGVVLGWSNIIYTSDGGVTWTESAYDPSDSLFEVTASNGALIAVGRDGILARSADQGISWTEEYQGDDDIFSIGKGAGIIFAAGEDKIWRSSDNGLNFEMNQDGVARTRIKDISFANNFNGAVSGDDGNGSGGGFWNAILVTPDGGRSWTTSALNTTISYRDVQLLPDGNGIYTSGATSYRYTTDYGESWTLRSIPGSSSGQGELWMENADTYYIQASSSTLGSGIFKTEDGGITWSVNPVSISITDFFFLSNEVGFAAGSFTGLYKTTDAGASWSVVNSSLQAEPLNVHFTDEQTGYFASTSSTRKTEDGGLTWQSLSNGNNAAVYFYDEMLGYVVNREAALLRTTDGGANWTYIISDYENVVIRDAVFLNGRIIVAGNNSDILSTSIPKILTAIEPSDLVLCDVNNPGDETEIFDLTSRIDEITGGNPEFVVSFYENEPDANTGQNEISPATQYSNTTNPQTIYVRLVDTNNPTIYDTTSLQLIVETLPSPGQPDDIFIDEGDNDGFAIFDLTVNESQTLNGQAPSQFTLSYFETQNDAQQGVNAIAIPSAYLNISNPQTIYGSFTFNETSCFELFSFEIETDAVLGINVEEIPAITVHPNPVNDLLFVTLEIPGTLSIYDLNGALLYSTTTMEQTQDISFERFASGLYFLHFYSEKTVQTLKVIKY